MSKPTTKKRYMHTIDGKPATFSKFDGQIVFADILPRWADRPLHVTLRASVRQIKRDQDVTRRNRESWNMKDADAATKYGYVIVDVPHA